MYIFISSRAATALFLFSTAFRLVLSHGDGSHITRSFSGAEINVRFGEELQERDLGDSILGKRQACGGAAGSCPAGQCCSQSSGRCGTGPTFCNGPDCQLAFGPACDGNIVPPGPSTANIARPRVGNVPYGGAGVLHCTTQGTVALTFDDGPFTFTQSVLDTLASYNAKATFFINGNNLGKGRIDDPSKPWAQILKNMYNAGHQIASHTWTHQDLTLTAGTLRENQVIYNEMAFRNIFGFCPTYIRPPYGFCNAGCSDYLNSMGYHIVYFDIDTKDYQNDDPSKIQISKDYFSGNVSSTVAGHSYISLSHDVHQQTAASLVTYMLDTLKARGYRTATVGECMGDPKENWYRDAGGVPSASAAPVASQAPTTSSKTSTSTTITSTSSSSTSSSSSSTSKLTTSVALNHTALLVTTPSPSIIISTITNSASPTTSTPSAATTTTNTTKSEGSGSRVSKWMLSLVVASLVAGGIWG